MLNCLTEYGNGFTIVSDDFNHRKPSDGMSKTRIVNRFRELLAVKERREGRNISQRVAAEEMELSKTTVDRYARNEVTRYDEPIVLAMCNYLGCTVGEFLVIEEIANEEESPENETALAPAF